ncbi:MAG: CoA pyrophosphatase [Bacteroidales bacterium]|nr:CoA pyrophosphatase [Bacteroidales bacterium]
MIISLSDKLPGKSAHLIMAPDHRVNSLTLEKAPPANAIKSAVLVLLVPSLNEWEVVLIKRNIYNGIHSGQVSFPGGKCDADDPDITHTACREAFEELGIDRKDIKIIGQLSRLYVPPSNYIIYPILATSSNRREYNPNPREVAGYIHVPLSCFNPSLIKRSRVQAGPDEWIEAPSYVIDGHIIWGATAMIIAELYQVAAAKASTSFIKPYSSSSNPEI